MSCRLARPIFRQLVLLLESMHGGKQLVAPVRFVIVLRRFELMKGGDGPPVVAHSSDLHPPLFAIEEWRRVSPLKAKLLRMTRSSGRCGFGCQSFRRRQARNPASAASPVKPASITPRCRLASISQERSRAASSNRPCAA